MATEVILPKLGQTMEKGAIVEWLKKEGDVVKRGDVLFTVESDKAVLEVEATASGYLRRILVPAGEMVPILSVVGVITQTADEPLAGEREDRKTGRVEEAGIERDEPLGLPAFQPATQPRLFASPRARKAARERGIDLALVPGRGPGGRIVERDVLHWLVTTPSPRATPMAVKVGQALGVDLAGVAGSGAGGRVMRADVEAAAQWATPSSTAIPSFPVADIESIPLAGPRRIIAERMAASVHTTARVTLITDADATALVEVRDNLKADVAAEWGFAPGYNDLLAVLVARALLEFPYMNVRLGQAGDAIERLPTVNLGIAVDTERGLLVPVIRDAAHKGLRAFGTEFRALVERARAGKALSDELSGGTFTITNLGMYDVDAFTPVINLPEAAILGAGRIQAKPVVRDGQVAVRQMWTLSLVFDHRLVDGAPAARFLQRIKRLIENPYLLLT